VNDIVSKPSRKTALKTKPLKKKYPLVIAYIEPSQFQLPHFHTARLNIVEAQAKFLELQCEKDLKDAVEEAHSKGMLIAVLRNDPAKAKASLSSIVNQLSLGCYAHAEFEDLRTIINSAGSKRRQSNPVTPNVVAGSGTTRGDSTGLCALQLAIANTKLEQDGRLRKVHGIFLIISTSRNSMKLSLQTSVRRALYQKIGFKPLTLYDTAIDESLGESIRVTLLAAI
jgi:hypothetical protein